uniref:SWIM-type domain-containing protein n=1 Tax=Nicotiana tabacum TaxID=4097 RepID=A0A1S4C4B8_TOBAC
MRKEIDLYMSEIAKVDKKTFDYLMEEPPESFSTLKISPIDSLRSRVREEGNTFLVDLNKRTCDCFQFQFDELPCVHAISAIEKRNIKKSNFCSDWYLKESWLKTYERHIHPVGHMDSWIVPESVKSQIIKPPDFKVSPGYSASTTNSISIANKQGKLRGRVYLRVSASGVQPDARPLAQ